MVKRERSQLRTLLFRWAAQALTLTYLFGALLWVVWSDVLIYDFTAGRQPLLTGDTIRHLAFLAVSATLIYLLLRRLGRKPQLGDDATGVRVPRWLALGLPATMVLLVACGALAVDNLIIHHGRQHLEQLTSLVKLRSEEISHWLLQTRRAVEILQRSPEVAEALSAKQTNADSARPDRDWDVLKRFTQAMGLQATYLVAVDTQGQFVAPQNLEAAMTPALSKAVARADADGQAHFTALYETHDNKRHLQLYAVAPFTSGAKRSANILIVKLVDKAFLWPFLQGARLGPGGIETCLFSKDGENVQPLHPVLNNDATAPPRLTSAVGQESLPVQVARAQASPGQPVAYVDRHGLSVIGVYQPISGTPWFLVSKFASAELIAELRGQIMLLAVAVVLGMLTAIGAGVVLQQRFQLRRSENSRRSQLERLRLQKAAADERSQRLAIARQFEALVTYSPLPLISLDTEGKVLTWNPAAEATFGWPADEVIGKPYPIISEGQREEFQVSLNKVRAGEVINGLELNRRRRDGSTIPVRLYAAPLRSATGDVTGMMASIDDVSAKRRMEDALRESEERFRRAVLEAPFPVMIHAGDGEVLALSRTWTELTGYDPSELTTVAAWTNRAFGSRRHEVETFNEQSYPLHGPGKEAELRVRCKDGTQRIWAFQSVGLGVLPNGQRLAISMAADITARIEAETSLVASRRQLSVLMDNLPGIVYRGREASGWPMTFLSAGCLTLTGYRPEEIVSEGVLAFEDIIHPDDREDIRSAVHAAVANDQPFEFEYRIVTRGGKIRHVWERGRCVSRPEDTGHWIEGFIGDVTERWEAERALRESEQRFRSFVENANDIVYALSPEGNVTYVSPNLVEFIGKTPEQLIGQHFAQYVHPDDAPRLWAALEKALAARRKLSGIEYRVHHQDGSWRWHISNGAPLLDPDGTLSGWIGISRDVTESKANAAALHKLSQAVEQNPQSIIITNTDAEIEYVNEAFVRTTGYNRDEVYGRNPRILKSEKTPSATFEKLWKCVTSGHTWQGEFWNQRKSGKVYLDFASVTPIRNTEGQVTHYLSIQEDITEKKALGEELDRHRHHLQELVAQRTEQLEEARARAEAANVAKDQFLANMSHEIRTPMNAITGITHLLMQDSLTAEQRGRLTKINDSAHHLLSIINDILDLSKIEAGKLALECTDFHIDAIFDHVMSTLRVEAEHKGLKLETATDSVSRWFRGDSTRLRQALLNYAGNAVKFTERGHVILRARIAEDDRERPLIRFEVEDTGIGIEPETLERLFEAFEQADGSTARLHGGTGLGLAITRRIAQMMDGEAGAKSVPGQGSTFWFTARLEPGRATAREHKEALPAMDLQPNQRGARVLLAEDNAVSREIAEVMLENLGLTVDSVADGIQAVNYVRSGRYDLVLMDMQMPGMDGLQATRLIRENPDLGSLPVLAMTANVFEADRRACFDAGMDDFVAKPVDPERLVRKLSQWLPDLGDSAATAQATPAATHSLEAIAGLDTAQGLRRVAGDETAYIRLLHRFLADHRHDPDVITDHLAANAPAQASAVAHALKGAAGTLGHTGLMQHARTLEVALKQTDFSKAGAEVDALRQALNRFTDDLAGLDEPAPLEAETSREIEPEAALLRLAALLAVDDSSARNLFDRYRDALRTRFGNTVDHMAQHIESYDFPAALQIVRSLKIDPTARDSRLTAHTDNGTDHTLPETHAQPDGEQAVDPSVLTRMIGNDKTRHRHFLDKFVAQATPTMAEFKDALSTQDAAKIASIAHRFKSSAGAVGALRVAELCGSLEAAALAGNRPELDRQIDALKLALDEVWTYVEGMES